MVIYLSALTSTQFHKHLLPFIKNSKASSSKKPLQRVCIVYFTTIIFSVEYIINCISVNTYGVEY